MSRLRRGFSVRVELTEAIGEELANEALHQFTRVELASIRAPQGSYEDARSGRSYAPRRSARATFAPHPVRSEDDSCTRHQALALLAILEGFWHEPHNPLEPRACGSRLFMPRIAARAGVDVREVQRYLAALRTSGLLVAWQPPVTERTPKVMRGKRHAYNVYRLSRPLPRVLRERLKRFQVASKKVAIERSNALAVAIGSEHVDFGPARPRQGDAEAFWTKHPHLRPPPV